MVDSDYGRVSAGVERRVIVFHRGMTQQDLLDAVSEMVADPAFRTLTIDTYRWAGKAADASRNGKDS